MWLVAMFDLPVDDTSARRRYMRFRKLLLREGFVMVQLSVYARFCRSEECSAAARRRIEDAVPERGEVRVVSVTDHQYSKMTVLRGKKRRRPDEAPHQLLLF